MNLDQWKSKLPGNDKRAAWLLGAAGVAAVGALLLWPRRTADDAGQNPPELFIDIRQELNGLVEEPDLIDLELSEGVVTLRGQVIEDELEPLIAVLESMPGVLEVIDQLVTRAAEENRAEI